MFYFMKGLIKKYKLNLNFHEDEFPMMSPTPKNNSEKIISFD